MLRDLVHDSALLCRRGKVDAALQHTAAVAVRGNVHGVGGCRVVHELALLGAQPLQAALDDMVAVQVPDQAHHALLQRICHQRHLPAHREDVISGNTSSGSDDIFPCAPVMNKRLDASPGWHSHSPQACEAARTESDLLPSYWKAV